MSAESSSPFGKFIEAWCQGFARTLSEAGLKDPKIEFIDAKSCADRVPKAGEKSYRMTLIGGGLLRGSLSFLASEPETLQLALLLASPAEKGASEFGDRQRDTVTELISRAATKVTAAFGGDRAKLELAAANAAAGPVSLFGGLRISAPSFAPVLILLASSAEFLESVRGLEKPASAPSPQVSQKGATAMPANQPAATSSNLGLLFDVQLDATIRFGGRQLLLRDILSLSPGSVIELDRQVGEPAELLVAGKLVARGEVVVVDGNFGLRVTELTNPGQRGELAQA